MRVSDFTYELPDALSAHDAAQLVRHVARPLPPGDTWQVARNRAAVALHLGAGLTPAEAAAAAVAGSRRDLDFLRLDADAFSAAPSL